MKQPESYIDRPEGMKRNQNLESLIKKSRRIETDFSSEVRDDLQRIGLASIKTRDSGTKGVPDIYASGGNWIESKCIPVMPKFSNTPMTYFSTPQRLMLDKLSKAGDPCFACVMWLPEHYEKVFLFMPWDIFRCIQVWELQTVVHFGMWQPNFGWDLKMERFFTGIRFNPELWWNERWNSWGKKDNVNFFNIGRLHGGQEWKLQKERDAKRSEGPPKDDPGID